MNLGMRISRRRGLALAMLAPLAAAAMIVLPSACTAVVDLDGLSGGKPGPDGGAPDTGSEGDAEVVCKHDRWPDRPTSAMEGGTEDFYAAVRQIDLGETKPTPEGFDLDGLCTCIPDGPSCAYPKYAPGDHCDGANGRDNSVANVFKEIQKVVGTNSFGSSVFSAKAEIGQWSLLIRVSQYNGQPDDAEVTVALYETYWDETGKTKQPLWDGSDLWPVATTSLADATTIDNPLYVDKAAYVAGNVIVASLPEAYLGLNGGGSQLGVKLTAGTLTGTLEKTMSGRYRISEGTIGARWKADDVFKVIGAFSIAGQTLCNDPNNFGYQRFKEVMCASIDIGSTLGTPSTACDSLSFGTKFSTEPAGVDKTYVPEEQMTPCSTGTDPANDTCDSL